jgi:transposase
LGVDVSKDWLDVFVLPEGEAFRVERDDAGLAALVERLQASEVGLVAVEATGGFENIVAAALGGAGLPLVVVNPAQVRHFAKALGLKAKTDPIDAAVIARFAEATRPAVRELPMRRPACSPIWWRGAVRSSTCWWPSASAPSGRAFPG